MCAQFIRNGKCYYIILIFLENAMYGEMHILLYMIVFVSITEFWLLNFHFKIKLEVIF